MTPRQERFVAEYLIDLNATKAAERAGYSMKTAYSQGQRLLKNVEVAATLKVRMEKRAEKLEITADRVLQEFAKVAFGNMLDYMQVDGAGRCILDFSKLTREQAAVINSIETEEWMDRAGEDADGKPQYERVRKTKFKLHDKLSALVQLGRHLNILDGSNDDSEGRGKLDELIASIKRPAYMAQKPEPPIQ